MALTATMNLFRNIALDTTPKAPLPTVLKIMYKTKNRFWQPKGIASQEFSKVWVNYTRITNLNKED